jgi:hypothetical protein
MTLGYLPPVKAVPGDGPSALVCRLLAAEDLDALFRLHVSILESMPQRAFMYARDLAYFQPLHRMSGRIIGAFVGRDLAGYLAMRPSKSVPNVQGSLLMALGIDNRSLMIGAGSGVSPRFRQQGIFKRLIDYGDALAVRLGYRYRSAVVFPRNVEVARTFLSKRYMLAACLEDEDGGNYLMLTVLKRCSLVVRREPSLISELRDWQKNLRYLRAGLCGSAAHFGRSDRLAYSRLAKN